MKVSSYRAFSGWSAMPSLRSRQLIPISAVKVSIAIMALIVHSAAFAEPYDSQLGPKTDIYLAGKPLPTKPSPIKGNGAVFFSSGTQWDVDPRLIVAIAGAESSFGTRWVDCPQNGNNAWSWFWHSPDHTCPTSPFASFAEGIMTVTKFMRLSYFNNGQTTIQTIQSAPGHQYCVSNCGSWVTNVTTSYKQQGGDPADLTFHLGVIDFEQYEASSIFGSVQPPLTAFAEVNGISATAPNQSATISGGSLLDAATFLPVDRSVVYGTASFCAGCLPIITIDFPQKVTNFSVFLMNGEPTTVTYLVVDDRGGTEVKTLVANLDSGSDTIMLPEEGIQKVIIETTGSDGIWDFLIDNIRFSPM